MLETPMSNKLKQIFPNIMIQNIETSTSFGVPDAIYGHDDVQGWMEFKQLSHIPVKKFKVPWRPGQLAWYHNYKVKYKNTSPYILVLTIQDSWYFIIDNIKESYMMYEITQYYVGETKDLKKVSQQILSIMFPTR